MRSNLRRTVAAAAVLALGASMLAGCGGMRRAVGAEKIEPDEFRVVTKAPLTVPPEYNLRPPRPGEPRPEELLPSDQARSALYGGASVGSGSDAEQLLLAKAGAAQSDPAIRAIVDVEGGGVIHKNEGFTNRVLFWRGEDNLDGKTLDAVSEEERLRRQEQADAATGGQEVTIDRRTGFKLPGL